MSRPAPAVERRVRFGDLQQEVTYQHHRIRYREVLEFGSYSADPRLRPTDIYRLIAPYLATRVVQQVRAVVPLALYLVFFQVFILNQSVSGAAALVLGFTAVIAGLMFFMEGVKLGLMPLGETIGTYLPMKSSLSVVLIITFTLGMGVTFAEPAVGALQVAGSSIDRDTAPQLHALLQHYSLFLVLVIGAGVGLAAVVGTLRSIYGWSLKPVIYMTLFPTLALTLYCAQDEVLQHMIALAWDSGAITTGPVTVPLVLALGIGVAAAVGKGDSPFSGFGIVTMASIFPVAGVLLLSIILHGTGSLTRSAENAVAAASQGLPAWHQTSPAIEIILAMQAILPLVGFLLLVLFVLLKERIPQVGIVAYGVVVALAGMVLFNFGLTYGLSPLGNQTGGLVPGTFVNIPGIAGSPLYGSLPGIGVSLLFAWILGFAATMAEPALNALGTTVESLTNGAFRRLHLMYAVSVGVGAGIALGLAKIIFGLSLAPILICGYILALIMTALSSEAFAAVAWDGAAVTTGPVTVPLVLSLGLSFGGTLGAVEGFGILAGASLCPVLSVLSFGLIMQSREKARKAMEIRSLEMEKENAS